MNQVDKKKNKKRKDKNYRRTEAILYNYCYIKTQVEKDKEELNQIYEESVLSAYDYAEMHVQTSNINDPTYNEAIRTRSKKTRLQKIVRQNELILDKIDAAIAYLSEDERKLIINKYFKSLKDYEIFNNPDLGLSERTYYRTKKNAVKKISLVVFGN